MKLPLSTDMETLEYFIRESNKIEAILRDPTKAEVEEAIRFLNLKEVTIGDMEDFVKVYQPNARLRITPGMNVIIGRHRPPLGGPEIPKKLQAILDKATKKVHPYDVHHEYETLHPFLDGNGRSGRMLWAWQMVVQGFWPRLELGFLHAWYYQSLERGRKTVK